MSSRVFRENVEREKRGLLDARSGQPVIVTEREIDEEKVRRSKMAALKKELYGEINGKLAGSVEWEDVVPIPHEEPEGALAAIAYPAEYAEGMFFCPTFLQHRERNAYGYGHKKQQCPTSAPSWPQRNTPTAACALRNTSSP